MSGPYGLICMLLRHGICCMDMGHVFLWEKNMSCCWRRIDVFLLDKNRCCLVGEEYMAMEDDFLSGAHCSCAKNCAMVVTG